MLFSTDQLSSPRSPDAPLYVRIVSLAPSQTELLFDFGLEEEVVGITKFCVHPEYWFRTKKRVGGTKNINAGIIHALQPDLVMANKEENLRGEVEELALQYPVWLTDIRTRQDALQMIRVMGRITSRLPKASSIEQMIEEEFAALEKDIGRKISLEGVLQPPISSGTIPIWSPAATPSSMR